MYGSAEDIIGYCLDKIGKRESLFGTTKVWTPLPEWAAGIECTNWAQFFLKFVISHPAVTCAIPATSQASHMTENMGALYGALTDTAMRARMVR